MRPFYILVLVLLCLVSYGQPGILDRKVTLRYDNTSLESVLKGIGKTYGIKFSYVNNLLPLNQRVSVQVKDQSLRTALDQLFNGLDVNYQVVSDQIVLRYAPKKESMLETYTAEDLAAARAQYRHLATLRGRNVPAYLSVEPTIAKVEMAPTPVHYTSARERKRWQLWLNQYLTKLEDFFQNIEFNRKGEFVADSAGRYSDSLGTTTSEDPYWNYGEKDLQITLITPLGTNGAESANMVNRVSINVLGGVAAGLEGAEFGGLFNAEKDYVHGTQFAGLANLVWHEVRGAQFAGLANVVGGYSRGVQVAGLSNVVLDRAEATQIAGLANVVVGNNRGTQIAGLANVTRGYNSGPQVAGLVNVAAGDARSPQIAGLLNVADGDARGVQVAGLANIAARDVYGVQIAGLVNHARKVWGSQIGVFNVADSVTGVPIGVLSFIKHGYKRVEMWGSESLFANVAFKTGTHHFYNILAVGVQPQKNYTRWGVGYGVGTEQYLSNHLSLTMDLISYQINENEWWTNKLNMLNQARLLFNVGMSGKAQFIFGPTFNVQVSEWNNPEKDQYGSEISPWRFFNRTHGDTNVRLWVGFNAGIRL